jgi:hypothetical protein
MDEKLWAGVGLKLQNAEFHLLQMERSLDLPEPTALEASGMIVDTGWHRAFYAHLDAFLSAARSVPEIIQCCFGVDLGHPEMKEWFKKRLADFGCIRTRLRTRLICGEAPEHALARPFPGLASGLCDGPDCVSTVERLGFPVLPGRSLCVTKIAHPCWV